MNVAAWGPAEWIAVLGALGAAGAWGLRVIVVLTQIADLLVVQRCWLEVLAEEFPHLKTKVESKMRARPSILGSLRLAKLFAIGRGLAP